jgi:hypothetical protein
MLALILLGGWLLPQGAWLRRRRRGAQVFNGSLSLAAPRKAETLVLAFLRHEAKSSDTR